MQTRGDLQTWERGTPAVEAQSGALVPPRDEDGVGVIVPGGDCEWQVVTRGTSPALRTLRLPSGSVLLHSLAAAHRPAAASQDVYQLAFRTAQAEWLGWDNFIISFSGFPRDYVAGLSWQQRGAIGFPHAEHPFWSEDTRAYVTERYGGSWEARL